MKYTNFRFYKNLAALVNIKAHFEIVSIELYFYIL